MLESLIGDYLKTRYPSLAFFHDALHPGVWLFCKECESRIQVRDFESLGVSLDTYFNAIIRRTCERHISECDGMARIQATLKPSKVSPAGERKIVLE